MISITAWKRSVPAALTALAMFLGVFASLAVTAPALAEEAAGGVETTPSIEATPSADTAPVTSAPTHTHKHHHHVRGSRWRAKIHKSTHPLTHRHCRKRLHRHSFWIKPGGRWKRVTKAHCSGAKHQKRPKRRWKKAKVSWYGPGLYGHGMAGGGVLKRGSVVVAHRSLPFGTKIQFSYRGRKVTAVVRDRGPYVGGRKFDLGPGTARKLRFDGVGTVRYRVVKYGRRR